MNHVGIIVRMDGIFCGSPSFVLFTCDFATDEKHLFLEGQILVVQKFLHFLGVSVQVILHFFFVKVKLLYKFFFKGFKEAFQGHSFVLAFGNTYVAQRNIGFGAVLDTHQIKVGCTVSLCHFKRSLCVNDTVGVLYTVGAVKRIACLEKVILRRVKLCFVFAFGAEAVSRLDTLQSPFVVSGDFRVIYAECVNSRIQGIVRRDFCNFVVFVVVKVHGCYCFVGSLAFVVDMCVHVATVGIERQFKRPTFRGLVDNRKRGRKNFSVCSNFSHR